MNETEHFYLSEALFCDSFQYTLYIGYTKIDLIKYFFKKSLFFLVIFFIFNLFAFLLFINSYIHLRKPFKNIQYDLRQGKIPEKTGYLEFDSLLEALKAYVEKENKFQETQRILQEELARQEKLAALGTMAGGLAHEFNNLLQMILTSLELAKLHLEKKQIQEASKHLSQIEKVSQRGQTLASRILFMSKPTPGESTDLFKFLENLKPIFRAIIPKEVYFTVDISTDCLCEVPVSEEAMKEVLLNLIKNAIDALEGTYTKNKKELKIRVLANEKEVLLEVSDTGMGMSEEQKKRIFEPFYTTKGPQKGTGLGLYMVYNIVQSTGGRIEVESSLGQGTTVKVYLPKLEKKPEVETPVEKRVDKPKKIVFKKTLVVDDEKEIREGLKEFLEILNLEVQTAPNGKEAFEKILSENFDLLLIDMYMPEMDGLTLVKQLSLSNMELPYIIIMTGYAGELTEDLKELLQKKIVRKVLKKPFTFQTIEEILHNKNDA